MKAPSVRAGAGHSSWLPLLSISIPLLLSAAPRPAQLLPRVTQFGSLGYNLMLRSLTLVPVPFPLCTLPVPGDTTARPPSLILAAVLFCATCHGLL